MLREMSILTSGLGYLNHDALLERGRLGEVPPCANNVRAKDTAFSSRPAISLLLDSWRLNVLPDDAQAPKMTAAIPQAWCNLEEQLQPNDLMRVRACLVNSGSVGDVSQRFVHFFTFASHQQADPGRQRMNYILTKPFFYSIFTATFQSATRASLLLASKGADVESARLLYTLWPSLLLCKVRRHFES